MSAINNTVKARCNEVRYSDSLDIAILLAGTNLVPTYFNDFFAVTIIVRILGDPY